MESVLNSTKNYLGIKDSSYDVFDQEIIMHINSTFSKLYQIGVDSAKEAMIDGEEETWFDLFENDFYLISLIKEYTYMRVRTLFDPPTNASVLNAYNDNLKEIEWRIHIQSEGGFDG